MKNFSGIFPHWEGWEKILKEEVKQPYFKEITKFINNERAAGKIIYPAQEDIFNALKLTPFSKVKAVILGQDPYHGPNQAHGLSFSVKVGVLKPPSLRNIFKELQTDLGYPIPNHGCLEKWAKQGVLLLNTILTVESGKPLSHAKIGWQKFTDKVLVQLNHSNCGVIFLLWGSPAQKKSNLINREKHHILMAAHPSPYSADKGFFNCKHFSKTNILLNKMNKPEIDWHIDSI